MRNLVPLAALFTIRFSNLSITFSSMQQQQAFIANAFGNLSNVIQNMRNNPQTQSVSTNSAVHKTVGNFSMVQSDSMRQVQPSSTSRFQADQARYENNEYRVPGQQGLQDNMVSGYRQDGSGDQFESQRNNEVQQQGYTENKPCQIPLEIDLVSKLKPSIGNLQLVLMITINRGG